MWLSHFRKKGQARFFDIHVEPALAHVNLVNTQTGLEIAAATTGIDYRRDDCGMHDNAMDVSISRASTLFVLLDRALRGMRASSM
ncbi:hypothetical protein [Sporisorium scitamineum]|uniref:Uncharacterized protein n=1 Tax=Sporisorium scitamineum TaxID=49012 RepID=A0A0F7RY28_9BASI|nr:hypothetical protein [Sporisorium scitamineum]